MLLGCFVCSVRICCVYVCYVGVFGVRVGCCVVLVRVVVSMCYRCVGVFFVLVWV